MVIQLSTTPSVRDDESSEIMEVAHVYRGRLNTVSTFVGLLLIETTRGVITWLACSHEDLDRHESMRKVLMSWIEKKEEQRNEWVFEKYFKRISLSKFMQEVVAATYRAPSATHIRASVWIGRTYLIGTLRRSLSVIRVYFYITQDSKIIPTEAQIPSVSFIRSILNSICLFHLEKILGKVLVRGVGYFLLYELHVLVGADPSGTTTVCAEEESRLLFSFATLLVSCF